MAPVGNPLRRKEMNNWKLTGGLRVCKGLICSIQLLGNAWPYDPSRAADMPLGLAPALGSLRALRGADDQPTTANGARTSHRESAA
jgi:hypothetical protein